MKFVACSTCGSPVSSEAVYCSKCGRKYPGLQALCPFCNGNHVTVFMRNSAPAVIGRDGREPLPEIAVVLDAAHTGQLTFLCTSCSSGWTPSHEEATASFHRADAIVVEQAEEIADRADSGAINRSSGTRILPRWVAATFFRAQQSVE